MIPKYTPTIVEEELERLINNKREYIAKQDPSSKSAQYMQGEVLLLERVQRELSIRSDYFMSIMAEDIAEQLVAIRKDPLADKFVGILLYYETVPRWKWDDKGRNLVACAGNVDGWGANMTLLGDGTFSVDSSHPGPFSWFLEGKFIPIDVKNKEEAPCRRR